MVSKEKRKTGNNEVGRRERKSRSMVHSTCFVKRFMDSGEEISTKDEVVVYKLGLRLKIMFISAKPPQTEKL